MLKSLAVNFYKILLIDIKIMYESYIQKNKELNKFGYCIVNIGHKIFLEKLRKKWITLFNNISSQMHGVKVKNDQDLIKLEKSKFKKAFVAVFDLIHMDPEIYKLASDKKMLNIYKKLGVKYPHYGTRPITRVDLPKDKKHSFFDVHQDFPYNKHSKNSLVVWIPLMDTGQKEGCLEVCPKSHTEKKIFKKKKNSMQIKNPSKFEFTKTKVKLGEALIFSQFLVHRSGTNTSNKIRFSLQLRVTDLLSKEYMERFYPVIK